LGGRPLVSVIIPTYNAAPYLPAAVRSVLAQSHADLELIIMDDGSTDATREVIAGFLDPRVSYYYQPNSGVYAARNNAIARARGELIAFCDADDEWTSNKLERQLPCFDLRPSIGVVYANLALRREDGRIHPPRARDFYSGKIVRKLIVRNCVPFGTAVIKRECFDKVGGFDLNLNMSGDWDFWLRVAVHYEFHYLNQVLYVYRFRDGQLSKNYRARFENTMSIRRRMAEQHPGLVTRDDLAKGCAVDHVAVGRLIQLKEGRRWEALRHYLSALVYKPGDWHTWKAIIKLVVNYDARKDRS
jgi:glycosyltransferase involved in cell wall biosynthesis